MKPTYRKTQARLTIYLHTPSEPLSTTITIQKSKNQIQLRAIPHISFGNTNNITFLGISGGYGYSTTLGALQNGIELDLSLFNSSNIDATMNTMTIGGSVIFSEVLPALQAAGKEFRKFTNYPSKETQRVCIGAHSADYSPG